MVPQVWVRSDYIDEFVPADRIELVEVRADVTDCGPTFWAVATVSGHREVILVRRSADEAEPATAVGARQELLSATQQLAVTMGRMARDGEVGVLDYQPPATGDPNSMPRWKCVQLAGEPGH